MLKNQITRLIIIFTSILLATTPTLLLGNDEIIFQNLKYITNSPSSGNATIIGLSKEGTQNVIIPKEINIGGLIYVVTDIAEYAFSNSRISTIQLPNTIKNIGKFAFYKNELINVNLLEGVVNIGDFAFYGNKLKNVQKSIQK